MSVCSAGPVQHVGLAAPLRCSLASLVLLASLRRATPRRSVPRYEGRLADRRVPMRPGFFDCRFSSANHRTGALRRLVCILEMC